MRTLFSKSFVKNSKARNDKSYVAHPERRVLCCSRDHENFSVWKRCTCSHVWVGGCCWKRRQLLSGASSPGWLSILAGKSVTDNLFKVRIFTPGEPPKTRDVSLVPGILIPVQQWLARPRSHVCTYEPALRTDTGTSEYSICSQQITLCVCACVCV